jgi:hypothetical protein
LILTFLYGILTLINYRGVKASTQVSNVFTVAKLVPLFLVAIAGSFYLLAGHKAAPILPGDAGAAAWLKACLLLVFAYGGFETALTPLSEAKNPRRDAAFALFTALITCTLLYSAIQWVVVGILPDPAHSERPLAGAARLWKWWRSFRLSGCVGVGLWLSQRQYTGRTPNYLRIGRERRLPFDLCGDPSSFSNSLFFDHGVRPVELAAGSARQLHLECNSVGGSATPVLRIGLCGLARVSAQAAGSCDVSSSSGNCVRGFGHGNLRDIDHRRKPGRIADPAGHRAGGLCQLAAG